ncbi:hypothetical protein MNBD_GAMMA07-2101 [hydrothermal vent metagenome]|uniref:SPOR domain-containing protein n=1 Tax=hydrothermal vent metagenome TaxID=652676 RepID=A0A3B0WGS8_9ZZZZ
MKKDRTLTSFSNKPLTTALVFAGVIALAACSPKPSPWSQSASAPWELRSEKTAEAVVENEAESDYPAETKELAEAEASTDSTVDEMGDTVVSVGNLESSPIAPPMESVVDEPMMDSVSVADEVVYEEEPMTEAGVANNLEYELDSSVIIVPNGGISTQPGGMYAVQVVASSGLDKLHFFIERYQLSDRWIAETNVDGKTWFVLMSGLYFSKSEAENAIANLDDFGTEPWIRTVRSVQMVMNIE